VGATRLLSAVACAMVLAFVPAASGATGDLTVTVSQLDVQTTIERGKPVSFGVTYTVRGPAKRRAQAMIALVLTGSQRIGYKLKSLPATVRPAIWEWSVTDKLPPELSAGKYKVVATITLVRGTTRVAQAQKTSTVTVG
jgi:hypothetical protein